MPGQAQKRVRLVFAGDDEQDGPCPVQHRIGQRHPPMLLVGCRDPDPRIRDLEHRIVRHQGRGMSVGPEAEMNEVEHGRCPGHGF
jgi:hypothetical protein